VSFARAASSCDLAFFPKSAKQVASALASRTAYSRHTIGHHLMVTALPIRSFAFFTAWQNAVSRYIPARREPEFATCDQKVRDYDAESRHDECWQCTWHKDTLPRRQRMVRDEVVGALDRVYIGIVFHGDL